MANQAVGMTTFINKNTKNNSKAQDMSAQELTRTVLEKVEESKKLYSQSIDAVRNNNPKEGLEAIAKTESSVKTESALAKGIGNNH